MRCNATSLNCVEVMVDGDGNRVVRNSQRPDQTVTFSRGEWSAFEDSVRDGQTF
ncbi:DUF397 domain-containing protein [Micromonospora sp. WMMA1363]|uniref:DUF397 domain-containing protein n=1 Tax=Micromonospora sp. WMMA1363 TaxID=3053985 RepID=UPI00259CA641|nr:DUF397 domain-containing protein [Micromonospora sp. WMMA1363]MDM4718179.1 DUF397 domain-containing protein [Micromonospora sp. WMMA1363]